MIDGVIAHENAFISSAIEWSDTNLGTPATENLAAAEGSLEIKVANEYGAISQHTCSLYGYDHVIEPIKMTHFR